jgi:hypothetical protein
MLKMSEMKSRRVVVVVGPGRSGTSVMTRALKVLGVDLGDNLMPCKAGVNDKGFWEDQDIYSLNLDMCKELKYDWRKLTPVPFNLLESTKYDELKLRAINVLNIKLKATHLFGIKDPQLTRLLPFWQDVFDKMEIQESYVIACRNPMSVARSLSKYTGVSLEVAYLLWFEYTVASLTHTASASRVVVDYDLIMRNPAEQLYRISHVLNLEFKPDSVSFIEYQSGFMEAGLRHTKFQISDLRSDQAVPPKVIELYELMLELATDKMNLDDKKAIERIERFKQVQYDERFLLSCIQTELNATEVNQKQVAERDAFIVDLGQTVESLVIDRDSKAEGLAVLDSIIRTNTVTNKKHIADFSSRLESVIADRDSKAEDSEKIKITLKTLSDNSKQQITKLNSDLNNIDADRQTYIAALGLLQEDYDILKEKNSRLNKKVASVYNSKIWRATAPLRWIQEKYHSILGRL